MTNGKIFISINEKISEYSLLFEYSDYAIRSVCVYGDSCLIGFDGSGVKVINTSGKLIEVYHEEAEGNYKLPNNRVRQIIRKPNGQIWIGTYGCLLIISPGSRQIIKNDGVNGLPYNSIYTLYQGKNDGIWVGTWAGGIAYFNEYNYQFHHIKQLCNKVGGEQSIVSSLTEDINNNIWIDSEDGGISVYNPTMNTFYDEDFHSQTSTLERIKTIYSHDGRNIWIDTFSMGFWHYDKVKHLSIKRIEIDYTQPGNQLFIYYTNIK